VCLKWTSCIVTHLLTLIKVIRSSTTFSKMVLSCFFPKYALLHKMNMFFSQMNRFVFNWCLVFWKVFFITLFCAPSILDQSFMLSKRLYYNNLKSLFVFLKINLFIITSICSFYNNLLNCFLKFYYKSIDI